MSSGSLPDPTFANQPFARRQWLLILAATLLAAALRLLDLGEWSLWLDEAHSWRDATMPLDGDNGFLAVDRRYYGLPFFLLRFLFGVGALGYDEWSLRLPFALMGIATVPLLAICGRRLVGPWAALLAACLLAIHPWHIFWSQNARGYVMVVLGSVLAMHRLYLLHKSGRALDLILAAGFVVLAVGSHPGAVTLVIGFLGFLLLRRHVQDMLSRKAVIGGSLLLLFLFLLPGLVSHYGLFRRFFEAKSDISPLHWFETVVYYFRPSILLLTLLGMLVAPRLLGRIRALYLACLLVVPLLALTSVGSQLSKVTARYALCALPVVLLLTGLVLVEFARRCAQMRLSRARPLWLAAVVPLLVVGDFLHLDYAYFCEQHGQRGRWREAAEFVREQARDQGMSGLRVLSINGPTLLYYLRRRHWFVGDVDPHPDVDVQSILTWRFIKGVEGEGDNEVRLHDPGVAAHFEWHRRAAARNHQLFAVLVTMPALREKDSQWPAPEPQGQFEAMLKREFELALYLPTWIGPKDESISIYLPKKAQ